MISAANRGLVKVVEMLLEKGANVDLQKKVRQQLGARARILCLFCILTTRLPSPWQDGVTALILAADKGHVKVVEMLLEKGANLDHQRKVRQQLVHGRARIFHLS